MMAVAFTELRIMLEEAGIPRELSRRYANEFIDEGKTSPYIINKYGDKLICYKKGSLNEFRYKIFRNEED